MHYNFCRIHTALRVTPATEADISDHVWTIAEIVDLIDKIFDMSRYRNYRFSITVQTDDRKLIGLLSVLAHISQPENPRQIHIEGQEGGNWERNEHHAIFHFSKPKHRKRFIIMARKLYGDTWKIKDQKEDDPPSDAN